MMVECESRSGKTVIECESRSEKQWWSVKVEVKNSDGV